MKIDNKMKIHPILFSTEMVQAIERIKYPKTQTRRTKGLEFINESDSRWKYRGVNSDGLHLMQNHHGATNGIKCPYGNPGDFLWVRETFTCLPSDMVNQKTGKHFSYFAECTDEGLEIAKEYGFKWKPSIHMPRSASRFLLKINSVKIERVNKITNEDAIAEGIGILYYEGKTPIFKDYGLIFNEGTIFEKTSFKGLWMSIHKEPKPIQRKIEKKIVTIGYKAYHFDDHELLMFSHEGFETWKGLPLTLVVNPWVWVIEFERVEGGVL